MSSVRENITAEVAVIGGGPAGLVSAIALKAAGVDAVLIAPYPDDDHRTTALLASSVTALATLGCWEACRPHAAPLVTLRIVDATRRLLRAPEIAFTAAEIGLDAFGFNIENRHLIAALSARAAELKLSRIEQTALTITSDPSGVTIEFNGGTARARLAIGADGQRSLCRAAAGISTNRHAYPQTALTLNLAHTRPHLDTATEFHTESGPFTLVPLPGQRSSLVCVLDPAHAATLASMPAAGAFGRDRASRPFAVWQNERRTGARPVSARGRDGTIIRPLAHCTGRRGGARGAADRRPRA